MSKCKVLEIEYLYRWQISMEQIHAEMYGQMLREIVTDENERNELTNSISTIPCIAEKIKGLVNIQVLMLHLFSY